MAVIPPAAPTSTAYSSSVVNNEGGGQTTVYTPQTPATPAPVPAATTTPVVPPPAPLPAAAPVNSMPAAALGSNPTTYSTYTPPATAHVNLAETAVAAKDAAIKGVADDAAALKTQQDTGKTSITNVFAKLSGQATAKVNAEEAAGLNTDKKSIDELTSNIESIGRSFDKQIEAVQNSNPNGALDPGVQIEVNRLQQQKASLQADNALVLAAKTRSYDTAKGIVDTRVDAETEDLKNKLTGLQFFYSQNQQHLDDDQKTVLTDKINTASQALDDARAARTAVGAVQLEAAKNGAPVSVVQAIGQAQDQESAINAAGGYLKTPKTGTGATSFTSSQIHAGAVNAGIPIEQFQNLTPDDKAYFVNGYTAFKAAQKQVADGTATQDDLKTAIDGNTTLSDGAKQILYSQAGIDPNAPAASGGGFWNGALKMVGALFNG